MIKYKYVRKKQKKKGKKKRAKKKIYGKGWEYMQGTFFPLF